MSQTRLHISFLAAVLIAFSTAASAEERPRTREIGIAPGVLPTGELNAITDVDGVRVGHVTLVSGDDIRTGVTAVLPHEDNLFQEKVAGAVHTANGFGKAAGFEQVRELGRIEAPILLTNTLSVGTALQAGVRWILDQEGNETVRSVNGVVGETNDGHLNEIRDPSIRPQHVFAAIDSAEDGLVAEGNVGAGTGTQALGFKAGIGTASRTLPPSLGGHTVGVLVQANFGGSLVMDGLPVGERTGRYPFRDALAADRPFSPAEEDGSIMVVIATDAPVDSRSLERMASRAPLGIARTGGFMSHGSGDFMIAFSTARRFEHGASIDTDGETISGGSLDPLFLAVVEATQEAIYNSLLQAESMTGRDGNQASALSVDELQEMMNDDD